jgi:hypothetical protein
MVLFEPTAFLASWIAWTNDFLSLQTSNWQWNVMIMIALKDSGGSIDILITVLAFALTAEKHSNQLFY